LQLNKVTEEIQYHVNESIHYLTLRAKSEYKAEFIEERWGVMLTLGSVYTKYQVDS